MTDVTKGKTTVVSRRIADQLRTAILDGEYSPGSRIRQEVLADRFGSSRIPVREALRTLQSDGLVVLKSNSGAWVTRLTQQECLDIYLIREHLEPLLVADSIENATQADIDAVVASADRLQNAADIGEYFRFDREFHLATYRAAQMPYLHAMVERLWNITQPYRSAYTRLIDELNSRWVLDSEHLLLVEAVTRRNVDDAKQIIQTHVRRTRVRLAEHPEIFEVGAAG